MKIVFMGTPDFSVPALEALVENKHDIVLVLTGEDKIRGRHAMPTPTPVKAKANAYGIEVLTPKNLKSDEIYETLRAKAADLYVVTAYGKLLPGRILELPEYGCVNIHASLLPAYRGAAPIQWSIINGEKQTGISTMLMNEGLDTGDILMQFPIAISENETGGSLFNKLSILGGKAILKTIDGLLKNTITPVKQTESTTEYASMLTKEIGRINWEKDAAYLERLVRALNPWPGAYTKYKNEVIKIWSSSVRDSEPGDSHKPGTITSVNEDGLSVRTGKGNIILKEIQMPGKKRMDTASFLRGHKIEVGEILD